MLMLTNTLSEFLVEGTEAGHLLNLGLDAYENAVKSGVLVDSHKPRPGIPTTAKFFTFWDLLQFRLLGELSDASFQMSSQMAEEIVDQMWASFDQENSNFMAIDIHLISEIVNSCLPANAIDFEDESPKAATQLAKLILACAVGLAAGMNDLYLSLNQVPECQANPQLFQLCR